MYYIYVDPALLGVSLEFFAFPGYTQLSNTVQCLANIQSLRGTPPPVRIGGTTQDRATYNASEPLPARFTVSDPTQAPTTLTYGPSFFTLASQLPGNVTIGLNRQLNNEANTLSAAQQAVSAMPNLFAIELGNEPEFYASGSPIIPAGQSWSPTTDAASQQKWHQDLRNTIGKSIGQGAVYLQPPTWGTAELIPKIPNAISSIFSFSGHSYPQSACGGASTNLQTLQSHTGIISYTSQYKVEATAAHNAGKHYFLAETNSATCGGGGISPTFGAALWIMDYSLQAVLNGVERLYFHQGTIANCAYCWWGQNIVDGPYYGAAFLSQAIGTDGHSVAMLDSGTDSTVIYGIFSSSGLPLRVLIINTAFFNGTGTRSSVTVPLTNIQNTIPVTAQRLTAPAATSVVPTGGTSPITLAGRTFTPACTSSGTQVVENVSVISGSANVTVAASEALLVFIRP
ncbi:glycoside hydrolase family 79 protein [Sphaerobolus stellatus SS14]|uniref:Glycoside hydrolase family 79 protein n=1 Tax=Sphaerobolus stellatus (strain SS14) TaxID=990650 RepID=A0A0C9T9U1_SPHS4|nr:glycoside hydrolase family 79 protein [Sphaerobolus stellatus SS14]